MHNSMKSSPIIKVLSSQENKVTYSRRRVFRKQLDDEIPLLRVKCCSVPLVGVNLRCGGAVVLLCHDSPSPVSLLDRATWRRPLIAARVLLLHFEQFHIKDERRIRWNCARR